MGQSRTAGAFLGSPYQKVEYLIGQENGSTKVGLTSSVAGYHGTWVHPNPGVALELNIMCVGAGGGGGGAYSTSGTATSGANGTRTIFGAITAFNGWAGENGTALLAGRHGTGLIGSGTGRSGSTAGYIADSSPKIFSTFGSAGMGGQGGTSGGCGGSGYIALTGSLTVTGNVDYIIGAGGAGGDKSGGNPSLIGDGDVGQPGVIILQYNSTT